MIWFASLLKTVSGILAAPSPFAVPIPGVLSGHPVGFFSSSPGPGLESKEPARAADTSVKDWIHHMEIDLPDIIDRRDGFLVEISRSNCTQLNVEDLKTSRKDGFVYILVEGIAASCKLNWSMKSTVVPDWTIGRGSVWASVNRSSIAGSFTIDADIGQPRLPAAIQADCQSDIEVTSLQFSGGHSADVLQNLSPIVKAFLRDGVARVACKKLHDASIPMLQNATSQIRHLLLASPSKLSQQAIAAIELDLLQPENAPGLVDVGGNPGMQMARQLVDKVLTNPASPSNLNSVSEKLLGPGGAVCAGQTFSPIKTTVKVPHLADLNISVTNFSVQGLDTSVLRLSSSGPAHVFLGLGFRRLALAANIKMDVAPDTQGIARGNLLTESFDLTTEFEDIFSTASAVLALNQTILSALSASQLFHLGCWAPAIRSALALNTTLAVPSMQASITPLSGGKLERAVDGVINLVVGTGLEQFADALQAVGKHAGGVMMRDKINEAVIDAIVHSRPCPPPEPTYSSDAVFTIVYNLCLALIIVAFASMPVCLLLCGLGKSKSQSQIWVAEEEDCTPTSQNELELYRSVHLHTERSCSMDSKSPLVDLSDEDETISHIGSSVKVDMLANSQKVVQLPSIYDCSLGSSVKDMLKHHVYLLAFFIIVWSGIWPYLKLLMMQFCWFVPTSVLSADRRLSMLEFLDNWGKWSLIDVFVLVIFMVAFEFNISSDDAQMPIISSVFAEAGASGLLSVYVDVRFGFHLFVGATLGSLAIGHVMTAMHRYAHQLGEYSFAAVQNVASGTPQRLCNVLRPDDEWEGSCFVWGPIVAMGVSLALVVTGIWVDTFSFNIEGLAGYMLGENRFRSYSVMSLGAAIPAATPEPAESGIVFLTLTYVFVTALVTLAYFSILIVLWCAPLSPRLHTHFFAAAQVLNGFSAIEVFVVSILVGSLQIQRFALAIIGDKCDTLNLVLKQLPLADQIPGAPTCFDVSSGLEVGFWILCAAAIISSITGRVMIARCKSALLFSADGAESFEHTSSDA